MAFFASVLFKLYGIFMQSVTPIFKFSNQTDCATKSSLLKMGRRLLQNETNTDLVCEDYCSQRIGFGQSSRARI